MGGLLFLLLVASVGAHEFQCRDQQGLPVDWFIYYKIPRQTPAQHSNPHIQNGTGFLYMDVNNKQWSLSEKGMESTDQAIGYTLQQYYENQKDPETISIFYNDQLPYPNLTAWSAVTGHSKGFVAFTKTSGFWMIDSIPRFGRADSYEFPSNAHYYGQMGICVSMAYASLSDIATQLFFNRAWVYSATVPTSVAAEIPTLAKVVAGKYQDEHPFTSLKVFASIKGQPFMHFAKAGKFDKDLYFDLVAPTLRVGLKVQTWQHETASSKNLGSWCRAPNPYPVFDGTNIALPFDISFKNYYDHSKFAVATTETGGDAASPWVCIGDINRQTHQMERGGGTMCMMDMDVYSVFKKIIPTFKPCVE